MINTCYFLHIDVQLHSVIKQGAGNHSLDHWPVYMLVLDTLSGLIQFQGLVLPFGGDTVLTSKYGSVLLNFFPISIHCITFLVL